LLLDWWAGARDGGGAPAAQTLQPCR
jgi:hypothetical protein